jgi:hypothetical protein
MNRRTSNKTNICNLDWLPPAEEWDFRSVAIEECRVASHWEYERDRIPLVAGFPVPPRSNAEPTKIPDSEFQARHRSAQYPPNYRQPAREFFPRPWETLTTEQRAKVVASFVPHPALQVRTLAEFLKRFPLNVISQKTFESYLEHSFLIVPNFRTHGVEVIVKELEKWARKTAKQYPQSRRANAVNLPMDALKWLAVHRLDSARRKARLTIEKARDDLKEYVRLHPKESPCCIFPTYASNGAWIKACNNARECMSRSGSDPSYLLAELA